MLLISHQNDFSCEYGGKYTFMHQTRVYHLKICTYIFNNLSKNWLKIIVHICYSAKLTVLRGAETLHNARRSCPIVHMTPPTGNNLGGVGGWGGIHPSLFYTALSYRLETCQVWERSFKFNKTFLWNSNWDSQHMHLHLLYYHLEESDWKINHLLYTEKSIFKFNVMYLTTTATDSNLDVM